MKKIILLIGFLTIMSSAFAGLVVKTEVECPRCDGSGRIETSEGKDFCPKCDGSGKVKKIKHL